MEIGSRKTVNVSSFGTQSVGTWVYHVLPDDVVHFDIVALLAGVPPRVAEATAPAEEAWVL